MNMAFMVLFCFASPTSGQESAEQFYKGKTIRWIYSSAPGSGGDLQARLLVSFLAKETGATIKYENMGSDEGVNWVYNKGSKDGLTMVGKSTTALIANDLQKAPGVHYEADKYLCIADTNRTAVVVVVSPQSKYRTLNDLRRAKGLKAGATSAKGALAVAPAVVFEALGLDGKIITGYKSGAEISLSVMRGEVDILAIEGTSIAKEVQGGNLLPLFALPDEGSEVFKNIPSLRGFGANVPKTLENALDFVGAGGGAVAMPPGVPQDRIDYMRKVFEKLNKNEELRAKLANLRGSEINFIPGKQLQEYILRLKHDRTLGTTLEALLSKYTAVR